MLDEILNNLSNMYTSELLSTEEELDMVSTQLKEERKFLKLLLKDEGESFNAFSPRSSGEQEGKVSEIRSKIQSLEKEQNIDQDQVTELKQKLHDLKLAKEELASLRTEIAAHLKLLQESETSSHAETDEISHKLQLISSFLPADPLRAKIELDEIVSKISQNSSSEPA